jgi:FkbM family methyltransferase
MQQFNQKKLNQIIYEISNKIINIIGNLLVKGWDRRLLGLSKLFIKTIIDVGANEGQFSQKISQLFPQAKIYAFEPLPDPCKKVKAWARKQKGKVTVFNLALGDTVQEIEIQQHLFFTASSSILNTTKFCEKMYPMTKKQETIIVQQSTLDREISQLLEPPQSEILIKLDVQGYEDRVIRGGVETFAKAKACIVEISLKQLYENQAQFKDIFTLMDNLGYKYCGNLDQVYDRDGSVLFLNAVFIK